MSSTSSATRSPRLYRCMEHLLSRFPDSGQSVPEFCKANNLTEHKYYYWRRKLGQSSGTPHASVAKQDDFVKVSLSEQRITRQISLSNNGYLLHFTDGRKLEIPMNFNPASLQALFSVLSR